MKCRMVCLNSLNSSIGAQFPQKALERCSSQINASLNSMVKHYMVSLEHWAHHHHANYYRDVYNVHTVQLPMNIPKKYTQHRCRVALNQADWCKEIYEEIEERRGEQPILIICENIKRLHDLKIT